MTSVIMLIFYIKHYIDTHKKELGILKALGYSPLRIAKSFYVFGSSIFIGTITGFCGAFLIMPTFYNVQNKDKILPEITVQFHPVLLVYMVAAPTAAFSLLAVFYAFRRMKNPVLALLKDNVQTSSKPRKRPAEEKNEGSFTDDLRKQMSASMKDLSSFMMGAMIMLIGLVLSFTTLFLAITTVINGNTKTIAMMQVFGYSQKECCRALLGGYRPLSYIGFAIGTVYQYALLRIMVDIVFKDFEGMPEYKFDFPVMFLSLAAFILIYETIMHIYSGKIKDISIKEIMLE